ncbi:Asp-tRNA(Asn)/Glu-tRNA(Gln) amidotransferase subunit GatB, partial [Candidatus Wolfebacteria bacterium CG03_land_8_20_14_0_80_36_15]
AGQFFEEAVSELQTTNYKLQTILYNYLTSDLFGLMAQAKISFKELKITPENFAELINIIDRKEISTRTAKDVLKIMLETGRDPSEIIDSENLRQIFDEKEIEEVVRMVIAENPKPVEDYKKGKENALQFLIGKAMAELKGRANPKVLEELFRKKLTS